MAMVVSDEYAEKHHGMHEVHGQRIDHLCESLQEAFRERSVVLLERAKQDPAWELIAYRRTHMADLLREAWESRDPVLLDRLLDAMGRRVH